jgi:rubrerythrin
MKKLWTDEEQELAERAAARNPRPILPTRTYDPRYPRILAHAQAEVRHFADALLERTVRGVEAVMNGRIERAPDVPPLGATGYRCENCGATTYGYSDACGKCGKVRGR